MYYGASDPKLSEICLIFDVMNSLSQIIYAALFFICIKTYKNLKKKNYFLTNWYDLLLISYLFSVCKCRGTINTRPG